MDAILIKSNVPLKFVDVQFHIQLKATAWDKSYTVSDNNIFILICPVQLRFLKSRSFCVVENIIHLQLQKQLYIYL